MEIQSRWIMKIMMAHVGTIQPLENANIIQVSPSDLLIR